MITVYNKLGLHNTLLCLFSEENKKEAVSVTTNSDFTFIQQDNSIIGVNIKNASQNFNFLQNGVVLKNNAEEQAMILAAIQAHNTVKLATSLQQSFVIGFVETKEKHPESDKLSVCMVNVGAEVLQIVCGAKNVTADMKVVVAKTGSMMPTGLIISPSVLRKVASNGMICSAKELALPEEMQQDGILVLPRNAPIGMEFFDFYDQGMSEA